MILEPDVLYLKTVSHLHLIHDVNSIPFAVNTHFFDSYSIGGRSAISEIHSGRDYSLYCTEKNLKSIVSPLLLLRKPDII